jgi:hypothetical protein
VAVWGWWVYGTWGWWVYGTEGARHRVATNETKTNYVQAVNYQTLEHRLGNGRDGKQKQPQTPLNAGEKISGTSSASHINTYRFLNIMGSRRVINFENKQCGSKRHQLKFMDNLRPSGVFALLFVELFDDAVLA